MSAQGMPPQILALFAPRLPLEYAEPICGKKIKPTYDGLMDYAGFFSKDTPPPVQKFETPRERKDRKKKEKLLDHRKKQDEIIAAYDPHAVECATKNPYATLFVGRLSYEVTEKKLKREFEYYGPIKRVKVITDFNGKSRGYAFIEYETEEALKAAYKQGDGKKIDGRRVLVDVERSRTVPGWIPRRLGGGKGAARYVESKKKGRGLLTSTASNISTSGSISSNPSYSYSSSHRHSAHNQGHLQQSNSRQRTGSWKRSSATHSYRGSTTDSNTKRNDERPYSSHRTERRPSKPRTGDTEWRDDRHHYYSHTDNRKARSRSRGQQFRGGRTDPN